MIYKYLPLLLLCGCFKLAAADSTVSWQFDALKNNAIVANEMKFDASPVNSEHLASLLIPGISGQALTFDGKMMLKVPSDISLNLVNNFTLDCVFRADKIDHYRTIIWKGDRGVKPEQINYYLNIKDGKLEFKFKDSKDNWIVASSVEAVIKAAEWFAVTITMDSNGQVCGYVNGKECFSKKLPAGLTVNAAPLYIGGGFRQSYMFEGAIDSISINKGVTAPNPGIAATIREGSEKAAKAMRELQERNRLGAWSFDHYKDGVFAGIRPESDAVSTAPAKPDDIVADGLYGKAFATMNGKNSLKVPHCEALSLKNNFTIRCIFKADRIDNYRTLLWKGNRNVKPQQINYYLSMKDGKPEFKFKDTKDEWFFASSDKPLVKSGKWYYLVVTMGDDGQVTGYLNGNICFRKNFKPGVLTVNAQPAYIGTGESYYGGGSGYPFDGVIDELSVTRGVKPPSAAEMKDFNQRVRDYADKKEIREQALRQGMIRKIVAADKIAVAELEKKSTAELMRLEKQAVYHDFFQKNVAANANPFIVTVLPASQRVLSVNDYVTGKFKLNAKAEMSSARNEFEGFQLVLLGNSETAVADVKIKLSELRSASGAVIAADSLEWGYIRPITSEKPEYQVDFIGDYPDMIMERQMDAVTVPASGFACIFVRVKVDGQKEAGIYSGRMAVEGGGKTQYVGISMDVKNFTLAVTSSCKVIFSFFEQTYADWYGYKSLSDEQKMRIYDFLLKYRITPNNIYSADIYPELKFLPELRRKGANFCTLGYLREANPVGEATLKKIIDTYRTRIDAVAKAGFVDMAYLYAFDELDGQTPAEKEAAKQIMPAFKKAFPQMKSIQTSNPVAELLPYFDLWTPLFSCFVGREAEIRKLKNTGTEFWWYAADAPLKPYPNFFLDYPVFDNRIIFTLSYMNDIGGVLYWCINREWTTNMDIKGQWPAAKWKPYIVNCFNNKRQFKNGMGNLVYPGRDGRILPSLRLENLRDGIEDYEYLVMLKKLTAELKKKQATCKLVKEAELLLNVPAAVGIAVNNYSDDPAHLMKYREAVADMIVKIGEQLK